jgi:hypothetical protein
MKPFKERPTIRTKKKRMSYKHQILVGRWWLTPVILATQEAEIRRTVVQSQSRQIVLKTLSQKTLHKNRAGGMTQGEGPEFKPQYRKKKPYILMIP